MSLVADGTTLVKYKNYRFKTELADTYAKRLKGLSGRGKLANNEAMLFIFDKPGKYSFWMQGMKFNIDILWLDEDRKVVHMVQDAKPCRFIIDCKQYKPDKPAKYVFEINAGTAKKIGLKKGAKLGFVL